MDRLSKLQQEMHLKTGVHSLIKPDLLGERPHNSGQSYGRSSSSNFAAGPLVNPNLEQTLTQNAFGEKAPNTSLASAQTEQNRLSLAEIAAQHEAEWAPLNQENSTRVFSLPQVAGNQRTGDIDQALQYTESGTSITVVKGDTLSEIAVTHGTTVEHLVQANNISNPDLIHVGQKIQISNTSNSDLAAQLGNKAFAIAKEKTIQQTGDAIEPRDFSDYIVGSINSTTIDKPGLIHNPKRSRRNNLQTSDTLQSQFLNTTNKSSVEFINNARKNLKTNDLTKTKFSQPTAEKSQSFSGSPHSLTGDQLHISSDRQTSAITNTSAKQRKLINSGNKEANQSWKDIPGLEKSNQQVFYQLPAFNAALSTQPQAKEIVQSENAPQSNNEGDEQGYVGRAFGLWGRTALTQPVNQVLDDTSQTIKRYENDWSKDKPAWTKRFQRNLLGNELDSSMNRFWNSRPDIPDLQERSLAWKDESSMARRDYGNLKEGIRKPDNSFTVNPDPTIRTHRALQRALKYQDQLERENVHIPKDQRSQNASRSRLEPTRVSIDNKLTWEEAKRATQQVAKDNSSRNAGNTIEDADGVPRTIDRSGTVVGPPSRWSSVNIRANAAKNLDKARNLIGKVGPLGDALSLGSAVQQDGGFGENSRHVLADIARENLYNPTLKPVISVFENKAANVGNKAANVGNKAANFAINNGAKLAGSDFVKDIKGGIRDVKGDFHKSNLAGVGRDLYHRSEGFAARVKDGKIGGFASRVNDRAKSFRSFGTSKIGDIRTFTSGKLGSVASTLTSGKLGSVAKGGKKLLGPASLLFDGWNLHKTYNKHEEGFSSDEFQDQAVGVAAGWGGSLLAGAAVSAVAGPGAPVVFATVVGGMVAHELGKRYGSDIVDGAQALGNGVADGAQALGNGVVDGTTAVINTVKAVDDVKDRAVGAVKDHTVETVKAQAETVVNTVKAVDDVKDRAVKAVKGRAVNTVKATASKFIKKPFKSISALSQNKTISSGKTVLKKMVPSSMTQIAKRYPVSSIKKSARSIVKSPISTGKKVTKTGKKAVKKVLGWLS